MENFYVNQHDAVSDLQLRIGSHFICFLLISCELLSKISGHCTSEHADMS